MQEFGVDLDEAKKDSCLMQKLAKVDSQYNCKSFTNYWLALELSLVVSNNCIK